MDSIDLQNAVAELYVVFGRYRVGSRVDGCAHCVSEAEQLAIAAKPLRELTTDDLSRYAFKAMTTWGDITDFKHFLPRLFELFAFDPRAAPELLDETLFWKLACAEWLAWPEDEQEAVRSYVTALWAETLSSYPFRLHTEGLVQGFARAGMDLRPFLEIWMEKRDASALRHLADFVAGVYPDELKEGWYRENAPAEAQTHIRDWLVAPRTSGHLEEAFFRFADEPFACELSDAVQRLLWLKSSVGQAPA